MAENPSPYLIFKKQLRKLKNFATFLNMRELQSEDLKLSNGMKNTRPPTSLRQVTVL